MFGLRPRARPMASISSMKMMQTEAPNAHEHFHEVRTPDMRRTYVCQSATALPGGLPVPGVAY